MKYLLGMALVIFTALLVYIPADQPLPPPLADHQWYLPDDLNEASGLAVIDDNTVLVHSDEAGVIYRISLALRSVEKLGAIGSPPIDEDLEGIALAGSDVYLVNSTGTVFLIQGVDLNATDQQFEATRLETGLAQICEIEGLAYSDGALLLPCKTPLDGQYKGQLAVFHFDIASGAVTTAFTLAAEALPGAGEPQPTAIDLTADAWWMLDRQRLLRVSKKDLVVSAFALAPAVHRQPEGLALLPTGGLVIVDDHRKGIGRLATYPGVEALSLLP